MSDTEAISSLRDEAVSAINAGKLEAHMAFWTEDAVRIVGNLPNYQWEKLKEGNQWSRVCKALSEGWIGPA